MSDLTQGDIEFFKFNKYKIYRIIEIIQDNPDTFNAQIGESCLSKAIEFLEANQWTPIEKGLPTENDMYLVTAMDILVNRLVVYTNSFLDGEFRDTFGFEIIAWMALPKAYQAEKEEKK